MTTFYWKQVFKADWTDFGVRFQGILTNLQHQKDLAETLSRYITTNKLSDIDLHLLQRLNELLIIQSWCVISQDDFKHMLLAKQTPGSG